MLVASRLSRPVAAALCRASSSCITCGPSPLSRARVSAAAATHRNLQIRRLSRNTNIDQKTLSSEDLLEKQVGSLSLDIHQKNRIYKKDLVRVLSNVKEHNYSTQWQGLFLLRCCSELLPDESPSSRMALAEQVWAALKPHTKLSTDHYNELLRCYVANGKTLNAANFISNMAPVKPNVTTYELILQAICEAATPLALTRAREEEVKRVQAPDKQKLISRIKAQAEYYKKAGDLNQAAEVIANMKALGIPASEKIFNSLIIGQGQTGNIDKIEEVLAMMNMLRMEPSIDTYTAIVKAHALNGDGESLLRHMRETQKAGFQFHENHVMELVKCAAIKGLDSVIPKLLKFLPEKILSTPSISPYMQSVTTQLVFLNCPYAALEVYKCLPLPAFGPKDDQGLHGRSLIRDCVKASMPINTIATVAQELMSSGRNAIAMQNACEAALQQGKTSLVLDLMARMKEMRLPVRPHYFWPLLVANSKSYGEKGVLNILSTMIVMEVKPDYDTILDYVLPYVSFSSPQNLLKKLTDCGLTVNSVLTPMMVILVSTGQVRNAYELCELSNGKVDSEKLVEPLIKGFFTKEDAKSTVYTLEEMTNKAEDKSNDWIGRFLCKLLTHRKIKHDKTNFVELVKALKESELKISSAATDHIMSQLTTQLTNKNDVTLHEMKAELDAITDERLVDKSEAFLSHIPHPRAMNETSLRSHLLELEGQGMNTRGVLRRLLQKYCREGDVKAAKEIVEKCEKEGVFLSAGMKASIFDLHVKCGELELAELSLDDLTKSFPNFPLDEFKVIDFATLMVNKSKFDKAFDLITEQSQKRHVIGGRNIEQNCWRLLDSIASTGTPKQTHKMFNLLLQYRYIKPTNALLGPIIRAYLRSDLDSAVSEFVRIAAQHKCTPLKHELLCHILRGGRGGEAEGAAGEMDARHNQMLQSMLQADQKVHGAASAQLSLISALAEMGYKKNLRKLFLDAKVKVSQESLLQRCQRFAYEKKVAPIEVIAECARDCRHIDTDPIYEVMLQVHQRNDDCQGGLSLWYKMQEEDVRPSHKFAHSLASLLHANNTPVPPDVLALLDKETKSRVLAK